MDLSLQFAVSVLHVIFPMSLKRIFAVRQDSEALSLAVEQVTLVNAVLELTHTCDLLVLWLLLHRWLTFLRYLQDSFLYVSMLVHIDSFSLLPASVEDTHKGTTTRVFKHSESLLLVDVPVAFVHVSITILVQSMAVLETILEFSFIHFAIFVDVSAKAVHFVVFPSSIVDVA